MRRRRTDYGTVVLHWLFVAAFGVAFFTGLRIATETPGRTWINLFDAVLPRESVWMAHMQAAVVLVTITLAYVIYLIRSGLTRRIRLDRIRVRGLFRRGQSRLGALNIVLYWIFFVAMAGLIVSGGLMYFGLYAGYDAAMLHWYGMWVILAFPGLHILTHFRIGGIAQLLRVFRPTHLPPPPPRLDAVHLLTLLAEQCERLQSTTESVGEWHAETSVQPRGDAGLDRSPEPFPPTRPVKRRSATLQSNPFVVATVAAMAGASIMIAADRVTVDHLEIHRINNADAPTLDGDTSDRAWRNIKPFSLMTSQGGNFDGKGETRIEVRAVHDGTWAYFLFTWEDPTRSLKQLPLVKEADGWHLLHNGHEIGDEHEFNEDKFSVLLTTSDVTLAGDRTFHAGLQPAAGAPTSRTGRGLHFTTGGYVDVWQWKATSGGPTGWMDDAHFGPPVEPTPLQASNVAPYRGGFAPDPGSANYSDNFVFTSEAKRLVTPRRLPRDLAAMKAAMGEVDLHPDRGDAENARWFITISESLPYSAELDADIPVGTVLPGVIIDGEFSGDRADVRCAARWASGHWALEVARRLDTSSEYDVPIRSGIFMRVAAFDHSEIRHTRHVRPIRLEVE